MSIEQPSTEQPTGVVKQGDLKVAADDSGSAVNNIGGRAAGPAAVVAVLLIFFAPILYVLSIGPVIGLQSRQYINVDQNTFVAKFYYPLEYAYEHSQIAQKGFDWYIQLWDATAERQPYTNPAPPTPPAPAVPVSLPQAVNSASPTPLPPPVQPPPAQPAPAAP
jgi:hypothetical protein